MLRLFWSHQPRLHFECKKSIKNLYHKSFLHHQCHYVMIGNVSDFVFSCWCLPFKGNIFSMIAFPSITAWMCGCMVSDDTLDPVIIRPSEWQCTIAFRFIWTSLIPVLGILQTCINTNSQKINAFTPTNLHISRSIRSFFITTTAGKYVNEKKQ